MGKGKNGCIAYNHATFAMLKGVPMPPKLKCSRCDKYKGHTAFSEKQLNDARMSFRNRTTYNIRCHPCNGGQLVEIECSYCGKTKGLDEFAKSQRSKPDSARCQKCTDVQLAMDPVDEQRYEDPRDAFDPAQASENNWPDYWREGTVTNSDTDDLDGSYFNESEGVGISLFKDLHNSTVPSGTLIDSDDVDSTGSGIKIDNNKHHNGKGGPVKLAGDEYYVAQSQSWNKSAASSGGSGVNTNSYGNSQSRGIGSSSVSDTSRTFNSNFTDQPAAGGWAKIKAYKKPQEPEEPEGIVDWESEDESNDDSDDSDDDYTEI